MNLRRDLGELESMMRDLESDLVERKESLRGDSPTRTRQAVCAFANDLPEPIFGLAVADGAIGSHAVAVGEPSRTSSENTQEILRRMRAGGAQVIG